METEASAPLPKSAFGVTSDGLYVKHPLSAVPFYPYPTSLTTVSLHPLLSVSRTELTTVLGHIATALKIYIIRGCPQ